MSNSLSYRDAGVDIDAGDQLVENIKPFAKRTMRPEVLGDLGGFGALVEISKKYRNPVLVSGTDGVGTKLKLAFDWDKHDTVGIDLVAMSVNDILVQGAEPLFFLDYFACGKLDVAGATPGTLAPKSLYVGDVLMRHKLASQGDELAPVCNVFKRLASCSISPRKLAQRLAGSASACCQRVGTESRSRCSSRAASTCWRAACSSQASQRRSSMPCCSSNRS